MKLPSSAAPAAPCSALAPAQRTRFAATVRFRPARPSAVYVRTRRRQPNETGAPVQPVYNEAHRNRFSACVPAAKDGELMTDASSSPLDPNNAGDVDASGGIGTDSANAQRILFGPRRFVRQGHVQTLLARRRPPDSVTLRTEQAMLLDAGPDESGFDPDHPVTLLGYYNPALRPTRQRGLVQIMHGWHGSSHSSDVLYISDMLLKAGYSVFRLNMRDHGPNLHFARGALNRGMFLGTLLNEVAVATRTVAALAGDRPFALVGGSLGGNFVLRLGDAHNREPIPNLRRIVAICPAVRPDAAAWAIDNITAYRLYFRARWMQSLRAKQSLFPETYNFAAVERLRAIVPMTEALVRDYSQWQNAQEYFDHYSVSPQMVAGLRVPTTIIAARDDAVIPIADIEAFAPSANVDIQITETGGHMGFVDVFPYRRWLPGAILEELERAL